MINSTRRRINVNGLGGKAITALDDIDQLLWIINMHLTRKLAKHRKLFSRRSLGCGLRSLTAKAMEADLKKKETLFKNIIKNDKLRIHINSEEERKKIIKTFFTLNYPLTYPNYWIKENWFHDVKTYSAKVKRAIKNYEEFKTKIPGSVTVEEVVMSSAGIDVWANYQPYYSVR